jgi:hypothetical protein
MTNACTGRSRPFMALGKGISDKYNVLFRLDETMTIAKKHQNFGMSTALPITGIKPNPQNLNLMTMLDINIWCPSIEIYCNGFKK